MDSSQGLNLGDGDFMIPIFRPGYGITTIPMVVRELIRLAKGRKWTKERLIAKIEELWK